MKHINQITTLLSALILTFALVSVLSFQTESWLSPAQKILVISVGIMVFTKFTLLYAFNFTRKEP